MEIGKATTLEEVRQSVKCKVSVLNAALDWRNMEHNNESLQMIVHVNDEQKDLKEEIAKTKNVIDDLCDDLEKSKELIEKARKLRERVQYNLINIPLFLKKHPYLKGNLDCEPPKKSDLYQNADSQITRKKPKTVPMLAFFTIDEFHAIPQYMKGRMKYEDLNIMVDEMNQVLRKKYEILSKPLSALSTFEQQKRKKYKLQEFKELKGYFFCNLEDLKEKPHFSGGKHAQNNLAMLRHCSRIKDIRIPQFGVYHVVVTE